MYVSGLLCESSEDGATVLLAISAADPPKDLRVMGTDPMVVDGGGSRVWLLLLAAAANGMDGDLGLGSGGGGTLLLPLLAAPGLMLPPLTLWLLLLRLAKLALDGGCGYLGGL